MEVLFFAAKFVQVALDAVSLCMILRMLMPLFIDAEGNRFFGILVLFTEFFVAPVRAVMIKLDIGQRSPIDWAFFATYLIIWLLELFLPPI